jgi:hypothetical protein
MDAKDTLRDLKTNSKGAVREADGHQLKDDVGNAGDRIRDGLGKAGDKVDDLHRRTHDGADRAAREPR